MTITLPTFTPLEDSLFLTLCGRALDVLAVGDGDEAESLLGVEPFDGALGHAYLL